jgi:hypothetical protein
VADDKRGPDSAASDLPTGAAGPVTAAPPAIPTLPTLMSPPPSSELRTMATGSGAPILGPPPAMPAAPPARYQLGAEIARGGMGRVVDATDTTLGRTVAFKEALTTDVDSLRRFDRETQITAKLEHPSIVPVHDAGRSSNGAPFYVMRKVSGRPLERMVAQAETLGQRLELIPHIIATAQAIAHAHARGIVHRDIKPSNILVDELGETVVIDWGLAKVIGEPDEAIHARPLVDLADTLKTRAGIVFGTPGFMAPEQLRGAPVDEGCDVYALGATLYHLLSRKPPHHAKTADEMMKAAVAAPPTPIRDLVEGVPPELSTIVDKALAHDPRVRYQNARALAEDLQRFLAGQLVAAHHYSPREKLRRFIRRNRGLSIAVGALVVVGLAAVINIVHQKHRADAAASLARDERAKAEQAAREERVRADQLTLSQARLLVDLDPTQAVAAMKPLARDPEARKQYWHELRAIAAGARAVGVAWTYPVSPHTRSVQLSKDGARALSAGDDGVIRLHDLVHHTTRQIIDLRAAVQARFADDERRIVAWNDSRITIIDAATGRPRELTTAAPILSLEVIGMTAYWADGKGAMWQLDLAGAAPTAIALPEHVRALAPSPDGRWIALTGDEHLLLYDRTQPAAPVSPVTQGDTHHVAWSSDSDSFSTIIEQSLSGRSVLAVTMSPEPRIVQRRMAPSAKVSARVGSRIYVFGDAGVAIIAGSYEESDQAERKRLEGEAVSLVTGKAGLIVAAATNQLITLSSDGDHVLPLRGARIEGVAASPSSPYVIAELEGRLLAWNLDDIQPRWIADRPNGAEFATADQVITGGSLEGAGAQAIDVATGTAHDLGPWLGLRDVAAIKNPHAPPTTPATVAFTDEARHVHLVVPGRPIDDIADGVDLLGFATADQLVIAKLDGAVSAYDVERRTAAPLVQRASPLLGLAWGRGKHAWVAAAFADGTLWRKNLITGHAATAPRTPAIDPAHLAARDGQLVIDSEGNVAFLHDADVQIWRAGGAIERLAHAGKPLDALAEGDAHHIVAFAGDQTVYTIDRDATDRLVQAAPPLGGTHVAMAADAGLIAVLDHGTIRIVDPLDGQAWSIATPHGVAYVEPRISADGRRVLARTAQRLLVWSLYLPETPDQTAAWLETLTNAPGPGPGNADDAHTPR